MKKIVISMTMATVVLTVAFAQEKRYGIESAILTKNTVVRTPGAIMEQNISSIQYIAEYGGKESAESFINVQGKMFTIFTMMKDGFVYTANIDAKQGTKVNMASMDDYKAVNYLNLTDEVKEKYNIEEKGNEQFLGKDCKRYELTVTAQGQTAKATILVWQGLPLKSTMTMAGNTMVEEVTEIQEGATIAREKFELPEGINFMEVKPQL